MARNLITDVAGLKVGNADDAPRRLRRDRDRVRRAGGRRGGRPRRGSGHARHRSARRPPHGRTHRRRGAVGRLRVRSRLAVRRPGLAARAGPRLRDRRHSHSRSCAARCCSTCSTAATRTGGAFRPIATSATRPRRPPVLTSRSGTTGAGFGATTIRLQGRPRLGFGGDARRPHRRRAGRGECLRQRQCRQRSAILGGAVRNR